MVKPAPPNAEPPEADVVICPSCGRRYAWRDSFYGNELHCKCGCSFRAQRRKVDLDAPDGHEHDARTYKQMMGSIQAKSPILEALENREDEARPDRLKDWYVPWVLLCVGWFGFLVLCSNLIDGGWGQIAAIVAIDTAAGVFVVWPITIVGIVLVANWFDKAVGQLLPTLLKTAAIALGGSLLSDVGFGAMLMTVGFEYSTPVIGFAFYIPTVLLAVAWMFDFSVMEATMVTMLIYLPKIGLAFAMPSLVPGVFP